MGRLSVSVANFARRRGAALLGCLGSFATGGFATALDAVEWPKADGGNGHWYLLLPIETAHWDAERLRADLLGGHLATVVDEAERSFLAATFTTPLGSGNTAFVGMRQDVESREFAEPDGGWIWVTGEPVGFWPFCTNEPNDAAGGQNWARAYIAPEGWCFDDWRPGTCCTPCCSLVEFSSDCNGDGVVDYGQILDGTFADLDADGRLDCCETGVPCVPCDADLTDDFLVDGGDIAVMLDAWGAAASDTVADLDADGTVDGEDLAILLGSWGPCP